MQQVDTAVTTFLFTDVEGSTRLWEEEPERMRPALARHDAIARAAVQAHGGEVVKMTGDGLHAAFADPLEAVLATVQMQMALLEAQESFGVPLRMRCGLHAGPSERRDNDFYGTAVNRAARVMSAAHGGQILLSQAIAGSLEGRLPGDVQLRDLGTVRLRDLASPERLYQLVHPRLPRDFPALRSLEATPNNLPHLLSSFVGRDRERHGASALLRSSRLVTLLGVGGLGKSRLALHLAADVLTHFPDGVWRVELAAVSDAHRVAQATASAMGVVEEPGRPVEEALARHVRDRRLLIVLDNCEHLIEAAAALTAHLLAAGAGVKILATSREPMRLPGESCFPLAALSVPGPRHAAEGAELAQFEAVRLFAERASAAQPSFRLTAENAPIVAAICHRLDGIPLAIELAAARVRSASVQQIAIRLNDRFRLLTGGDPTASPRQRTLLASIDWSHELLPPEERALFRRLAVFAGGWTLESAEEVCAGDAVPRDDTLDVLSRLVDKSLVQVAADGSRYQFLESVREFARGQLEATDEAGAIRQKHFEHFRRLAEGARANISGPGRGAWLARLDAELANLLAAHEWAGMDKARGIAGLELIGSLKHYWVARGLLELGRRVTFEALERPAALERSIARSRGLFHGGQLLSIMGRFAQARQTLEECLGIAREAGDVNVTGAVLQPLGVAAFGEGDLAMARSCLEEALAMAEARGEKRGLAAALNLVGQFHRTQGSAEKAAPLYGRALLIAREIGDRESEVIIHLNLALNAIEAADAGGARAILADAAALVGTLGSARIEASVVEACSGLASLEAQWIEAARFLGAAEAFARNAGFRRAPFDEAFLAPMIARVREALDGAAFTQAEAAGAALPISAALEEARAWLERPTPAP